MIWTHNKTLYGEQILMYNMLKANNVLSDRKSYTRLKNKFDEICQKDTSIIHDKHIKELDDAIKNLKAYI